MQDPFEYHPTLVQRKAVALVAHGLNMKPEGMLAITQWLNEQGTDIYLVKLSGHHDNSVAIKHITTTLWEEEMVHGYRIAKAASVKSNVPLFFIGYSLGALLGQAMMLSLNEAHLFDKQILLAPATAVRDRSYILKLFAFISKRVMLPSFTPSPYRANNFLPFTAFEVLFRNERKLIEARFYTSNIPTLIFIDPKDELISYKKLVSYSRRFELTNHEIVVLDSNLKVRQSLYHHLIVSEQTMGKENWVVVTKRMAGFLFTAKTQRR